ncbi:hypothetical protein OSB04_019473 [Centaurea solstitialis]|uniref:Uncharacterized protein n=1 Tax=Centaurea solstitialis TaxID=347529 RepID=A0AA38SQE4_9ASTR|nr:hypothetical protein OSB04_019473 [Centaurea solstitialis]
MSKILATVTIQALMIINPLDGYYQAPIKEGSSSQLTTTEAFLNSTSSTFFESIFICNLPVSSTVHTTIPPNTGTSSGFIPTNPVTTEDPLNVRWKSLEEQNQKLFALHTKLPGAAVPIEVEPKTRFQASPFVDEIALVDVPKKYSIPAFATKYSGVTDPVKYVAQYKQLMWTVPIPTLYQEVCMCKSFGSTLTGAALQWLINLKPKTKRHARDAPDERPIPDEVKSKAEKELDAMTIVFDQDDTQGVHHKHHDALVIQLTNGNCSTKRILIDGGSSANVIFANTLKVIGIERSEIVRRSTTLIGFNGDSRNTLEKSSYLSSLKGSTNKQSSINVVNSHLAQQIINDEVDNLLKTGNIREVKYPDWVANVVVVQKKNGKWRVCIDFTDLNKACPKDPFPLPHNDAMVDATAGHELLTFMDAYSGYNQILMHTNDQEKTAFMTDKGIYYYKVMPFGLKNAGSTCQRLVNTMFKEHLGRTMEVYIDDMLVKSERSIDHVAHLKKILGISGDATGNRSKPEQVKAVAEIQSSRNVKEVKKLTGHVAALNRLISRSSDKCHLFYNVLRKNQGFQWMNDHEKALQDLKQYMVSLLLLTKPVEGESLQLYLAVSNNATSAVLVREEDQQQRPIYYVSKSFLDVETRYTSMEKLLLGLMTAAEKLRHYFESHHIIVVTNYPLKTVLRKPELTGCLAKWSIYLSGFDIEFKPKTVIKSQALADFVAEFSPGLEPTTCDEIVTIQDNQSWSLYVEGSSNIRGAGLGVVLKSLQGGNMVYSVRCEFKATNNEAEYEALIAGLDIAHKLGAKHLDVVKQRIARFDHFSIEQIPRDQNTQADALANLGSAFNDPFMKSIPILHLTTPTIEIKEEVQMNEETYNWSLDIWNYLKHDNLPEDKMEARKTRSKASRYTIFEDQLYRRSTSGLLLRCVISQPQMNRILQEMHDGECGNHAGGRSLANRISRQGYYWPTLREGAIRFGVPSEIMCDNGSQFISDKTRTFCERRGIKLVTSTPREQKEDGWKNYLTSYGQIERHQEHQQDRHPYSLVYGCEAVLPVEAQIPVARNRTFDQNAINLSYDLDALEELREKALCMMAAQKGTIERHFNKKVKAKIFQVGDYVLRHVLQNTQEQNARKLSIKWEGSYIISKVVGNGAYRLTTMEGIEIPRSWNVHQLKRYYF